MAPTLSRMHAGGSALAVAPNMAATNANANNSNNNACSAHVIPQHRHTVSITHTKGLLNAPGQNNCFLNSAVQVLWHLDIFRRSFRELSGHACMADSCIFCALKELFAQFQYSHESALPPDALRRALAETFFNQQRFQLGFMDDAAECFENILLRIHFHIANNESEDMCNAVHCIPHQKFAMTLVEQGVCHGCGATSEPLPFTQMVHYVTSSTLCSQAKLSRENGDASFLQDFGKLLRKAGGMGEIRDCPSACGAKIQIQRTLMNHPEIMSIGIVWDSERPTLDHIMDVFQAIGSTIHLRDVFHTVVDDRWAASAEHQLVGVVTYYGKHYSTFFFHTKLRVWIYFDDATVREIGPRWEQVVEKCRRGHFQPLLLLYANPHGNPVITESAPKTVVYSRASHLGPEYPACRSMEMASANRSAFVSPLRRAMTPNPEKQHDAYTDVIPRRAITPNPEVYYRQELQGNSNYQPDRSHYFSNGNGVAYNVNHRVENGVPPMNNLHRIAGRPAYPMPGSKPIHDHVHSVNGASNVKGHNPETINSIYNMELLQHLLQNKCSGSSGPVQNGHGNRGAGGLFDGNGPLRTNGYFNNCDVIDGDKVNHQVSANQFRRPVGDVSALSPKDANNDMIYISRKAVENVLNYQKLQRHRSNSENNDSAAGSRNSNSSLESFENAFRMRSHYNVNNVAIDTQRPETADVIGVTSVDGKRMSNVPRCRDSGNWSGDRNSSSSTSSNSVENPYFSVAGNKRVANGVLGSPVKGQLENGGHRATYDAGYDSFSLSSNDSFPMSHVKHHNQHLAQILENPNKQLGNGLNAMTSRLAKNQTELVDECHLLCLEADTFLEKSLENEKAGDLDAAISFCNGAAAKARAAMDAPYSNPQILAFARMKHNTCVMRTRTLHRRQLVRKDSISSHGSSTCTDLDSPQKPDGSSASTPGHHSRQSSRDSTRSRNGNHSRQSSRDGNHSRQGSKDSTLNGQQSNSSSDKKRIELYGTLPKRNSAKKAEKTADASFQYINGLANGVSAEVRPSKPKPVSIPIVRDTRIPRRISFRTSSSLSQLPQHLEAMNTKHAPSNFKVDVCKKVPHPPPTVDRDVKNMAEAKQKSTLHRTNSIPSNFISKMEASAKKNASMDAILPATQPGDGSGGNAKVGKKQHKIRRKLLMGGLIRRKNRSMPDLREGQNTSQSLESNPRCYDDSSLQTDQHPSSAHTLDNRRSTSNLSCQDIYYASQNHHQHHHSSHGKIPPPPPVRTTSQLTSRSQSHGNLFNAREQKKTAFAFPCPVVPYSGTVQPTKMSANARTNLPGMAQSQLNEVTTLADVHHERTPSDSIRPVSLARTMSMRGLSPGHCHQRAMLRNEANLSASSSSTRQQSSLQSQSPQVDRVTPVLNKVNQFGVADGRLNSSSSEPTNSPVGGGSSLLEQLLSKRQQMLDNPSKVSQETSLDVKAQLPKSEGWLQELQAKQQLMLGKKPVALPTRSTPSNAQTNGLPTTTQAQSGMPNLDQQTTRMTNHSISKATGLQCKNRAATPNLIAGNDECTTDSNYRPKSVRDLANRFEKILVSPPAATPSNDSVQVPAKNGLGEQTSIPQQQQQQQQQPETQLQGNREQVRQIELETRISPSSEQRHQQYEQYNRVNDSRVAQMMSSPAVGYAQDIRNCSALVGQNISPSVSNCQQQIGLVNGVTAISRVQQQSDPGLRSVGLIPPPYPGPYSSTLPGPFAGTGPPMARNGLPVVANSVPTTKIPMGMCTETVKQAPSVGQTDRTIQRKKGKKSVTFSDQIVLVACADDHEGFSLLNPLLEKVLHNKSISTNALKPQDQKPPSTSNSNGGYYQLDKAGNMESAYRQQTPPVSNQYSMSSDRVPQKPLVGLPGNSFDFPSGLPARPPSVNATYHGLHKPTGNVAASTPEVPCYLCRKKTVIPPVVYCVDCEFYMSRFKN